jgi:hypothetical protein
MADSANNDTVLTANDLGTITSSLEFSGVLNATIGDSENYYTFDTGSPVRSLTTSIVAPRSTPDAVRSPVIKAV